MGGARETTVSGLRIHESGGEVHFHDDKVGRKVAVPVAEWSKAWETIKKDAPTFWERKDAKNNTKLEVTATCPQQGSVEVALRIASTGPKLMTNADLLERFTLGV